MIEEVSNFRISKPSNSFRLKKSNSNSKNLENKYK